MGFNAEEFVGAEPEVSEVEETVAVEEPVKAVEAAPEPVKATEKAPEPVKAEVSKVAESFLDTDDEPQGPEQQVPVHVVAELRAKNRELKEQLKTLQTPTAAGYAGTPAGIQMPDIPDDELLTGAQVKTILPRMMAAHAEQIEQRIQSRMAVSAAKATTVQSLAMARNAHADYDAVVGSAVSLGMLTGQDRAEARSSVNPAEYLFQKAQEKISLARSMFAPQTPATTPQPKPENKGADQPANPPASAQTEQERILSDNEYFESLVGAPKQKELE